MLRMVVLITVSLSFFFSLPCLLVQVTGKLDFTVKAVKLSTTAADTLLAQDLPAGMRLLFAAAVWVKTPCFCFLLLQFGP
jgi:hypothetical protein